MAADRRLGIVLLVAALAVGAVLAGREAAAFIPAFAERVARAGALGPALFVAGYALATVAFVPGSLLTLAAGAIFGVTAGVAWVFLGAVLGSTLAFLIARHVARARIERRIAGDARFAAIDRAVAAQGRRIVLLLRLSPIFPFSLLNYALGLTTVRLADYVVASIGMLPGTMLYVYTGKVAGDVAALAGGAAPARGPAYYGVLAAGLLATALVTVQVTRIARRALTEVTGAR